MSDVQVAVGADITPFQKKMAEVRTTAKETGEKFGLEFGRKAAREERHVTAGLEQMITKLTAAKSPVEALGAVVEGVGQSFMIASAAFAVIGIGAVAYAQFEKASDSAKKLEDDISNLGKADAENESVHQLQSDIDGFQKIADKYQNRGMIEKIFFGAQEDIDFSKAAGLNELKKNLLEIKQLENEAIKLQARGLEARTNPADQAKGKMLMKHAGDVDEQDSMQQQLEDAQKKQDILLGENKRALELVDRAKKQGYGSLNNRDQKDLLKLGPGIAEREKAIKDGAAAIAQIKANQAKLVADQDAENAKEGKEQALKASNEATDQAKKLANDEARAVKEGLDKKKQIEDETAEAGMDGPQKAAALKKKIADEQKSDAAFTGPKQGSQILREQNQILEDQLSLKKQIAENDKSAAEKARSDASKALELANKLRELKERHDSLVKERSAAASDAATAAANAMGFHGQVSSLRKVGFGKAPGVNNNNEAQLKAAQAATARLESIDKAITELNGKIGGTA